MLNALSEDHQVARGAAAIVVVAAIALGLTLVGLDQNPRGAVSPALSQASLIK